MSRTVGVVGLGLLGSAIARRLAAAGYAVLGFDIDGERVSALVCADAGSGVAAATPAGMAARCDCVVLAVFTAEQAAGAMAALGKAGSCQGPRTVVCTTTCDPAAATALHAAAGAAGWQFVEAPVSGTSAQVLAGEGTGMAAGVPEALAHVEGLLAAICPRWHRLPSVGDAARAKLAVNLVLGLNRMALAEGLVFAERQGLDGTAFLALLRDSAAYSQTMDTKGVKMLLRDYRAEGKAEQALKDATLMCAEAEHVGLPLPLLNIYAATLSACVEQGEGGLDSSVVVEEVRRRAGAAAGARG